MSRVVASLRPDRDEQIDVWFAVVLAVLGVVGFRTTFSGGEELQVGVPAVAVGAAVGFVLAKRRVPLLVGVAVGAVLFFVLGGVLALRHRAVAGVLPGPGVVDRLAHGLVHGWKELLTTLPPAGEAGDLLTVPYFCGFVGGAASVSAALAFRRLPVCVVPPIVLLAVSVLFGVRRPASLVLQGAVFAGLTITWVSVRHRRNRELATGGAGSRQRMALAGGLVVAACAGGLFVGPHLPGAGANERYVLRDEVEPPFDPLSEPSALAAYRDYTDEDLREEEIATVRGLPEGARLRIAVMDDYDGLVWRSTGSGSVLAGEYLRVGATLPTDGFGPRSEVEVEIHRPHGVWVPLAGDVRSLDFTGDRGAELDEDVRVSIQTDSAAVPDELRSGDTYEFEAEFPEPLGAAELAEHPLDSRFAATATADVPAPIVAHASELITAVSGDAGVDSTPFAQVEAMAAELRTTGGYTDGGDESPKSPPGHSLRRVLQFFATDQAFGNGEQFGASLGLLVQARGIPVRVVMGFVNDRGSNDAVTFSGEDIDAWVEVPVAGVGWVPVSATPPEDQKPRPIVESRESATTPEPQPPPATTIPPPTTLPDTLEGDNDDDEEEDDDETTSKAGFPILAMIGATGGVGLVLLCPAALVVGLKSRRRRRRRLRGTAWQRISGSFAELVDLARDTGAAVPARATRRELSVLVPTPVAAALADRADAAVFGDDDAPEDEIDMAWSELDVARWDVLGGMSRWARLRAALSPASLRRMR